MYPHCGMYLPTQVDMYFYGYHTVVNSMGSFKTLRRRGMRYIPHTYEECLAENELDFSLLKIQQNDPVSASGLIGKEKKKNRKRSACGSKCNSR